MQIINTAYEVLSDPVKRAEHDAWIAKERMLHFSETKNTMDDVKKGMTEQQTKKTTHQRNESTNLKGIGITTISVIFSFLKAGGRFALILLIIVGVIKFFNSTSSGSKSVVEANSKNPSFERATSGIPNCAGQQVRYSDGRLWPSVAQVMNVRDRRKGLSGLLLDNSRNDQNLYVKLVLSNDKLTGNHARAAFIPAYQQLMLSNIAPGNYVVKMMNIADGCAQVSPVINLAEITTDRGIEYSDHSLTFYPVANGNTHLNSLPASQF